MPSTTRAWLIGLAPMLLARAGLGLAAGSPHEQVDAFLPCLRASEGGGQVAARLERDPGNDACPVFRSCRSGSNPLC